ncbi:MAG: DUF4091 domain-containing protein [Clostridia bacterium]|nr:DUF4091 domain-containing protein [Clostridia bacterium]
MAVKISVFSSLEKIFSCLPCPEKETDSLYLINGERGALQFVVESDEDVEARIKVKSGIQVKLFRVDEIYSSYTIDDERENCTVLNDAKPGYYPDLLSLVPDSISLERGKKAVFWLEVDSTDVDKNGYSVEFAVECKDNTVSRTVNVYTAKEKLPAQQLKHMNWFHADCLADFYKVEVFSEEFWRIVENFIKNAVSHGINCLLTPIFTPPLDTEEGGERTTVQLVGVTKKGYNYTFDFSKLDRWVDMAMRNGVQFFEISHLFTQWGAEYCPKIMATTSTGYRKIFGWENKADSQGYKSFLRQFSVAFKEYTDKKGITDICFVHTSDEPNDDNIRTYAKASKITHEYFSAYRDIDALSHFEIFELGLVGTPIPSERNIEEFKGKVENLWTYYCCGPIDDNAPNRFFCLPSIRNRILGVLLYKYDCEGFLHWGYNFYNSQYSKEHINPFEVSDAGGHFPSGDSYIVYPGENGQPLSSLRQKVFYEGIQDISALRLLEQQTSREYALEFLEKHLGDINFTNYPLDNETFLSFRKALVEEIK